jgi:hypothetical protein
MASELGGACLQHRGVPVIKAIIRGAIRPARTPTCRVMSTIHDGDQAGERPALALVPELPGPRPWYATPLASPALDRRELEDEHTRVLAQAVGDHLPYELALRAAELAVQLQRTL